MEVPSLSHESLFFLNIYLFIWLCQVFVLACRIFSCDVWDLVPWPGIEPRPPALGAWSLNHWITREVPLIALMLIFQSLGLSQVFPLEQELHFWLLLLLLRRFSCV